MNKRKSKGWVNKDGSDCHDIWEKDICAIEATPGDMIIHKGAFVSPMGGCKFHGNPNGYWNGKQWDFILPPDATVTMIFSEEQV